MSYRAFKRCGAGCWSRRLPSPLFSLTSLHVSTPSLSLSRSLSLSLTHTLSLSRSLSLSLVRCVVGAEELFLSLLGTGSASCLRTHQIYGLNSQVRSSLSNILACDVDVALWCEDVCQRYERHPQACRAAAESAGLSLERGGADTALNLESGCGRGDSSAKQHSPAAGTLGVGGMHTPAGTCPPDIVRLRQVPRVAMATTADCQGFARERN